MADKSVGISIHAPREGSDPQEIILRGNRKISIHAPREGSDSQPHKVAPNVEDFNPRSPRGERLPPSSLLLLC